MKKLLLILSFICVFYNAHSDDNVSAEYTYHATEHDSPAEAKQIALQRARIVALENKYGRMIIDKHDTDVINDNGKTSTHFISTSNSEVKGEWVKDLKDPEYEIFFENNMLVVTVKVWGKAREITSNAIDLDVAILKNGTDRRYECEEFNDGDQLFVGIKTPVNGYLAIYYIDKETEDAFCLLPYSSDSDGQVAIVANHEYVFFSPDMCASPQERALVDEILLPAGNEKKIDEIVVIFSNHSFFKALDNEYKSKEYKLPRGLKTKDFNEWLNKCRSKDKDMIAVRKHITITKK